MLTNQQAKTIIMAENTIPNEELNDKAKQEEQVEQEVEQAKTDVETDNSADTLSEIDVLNDKYLRLYSEFENYRKRSNNEKLELISTASAGVLKDLVSVIDDFERAIANNETSTDVEAMREGFKLIYSKFKSTLEAKGLKQMEAKNEPFNPDLHDAIANIPAPSEDLKGKVIDDVEKGYFLNDKVIRFAKVVVGN